MRDMIVDGAFVAADKEFGGKLLTKFGTINKEQGSNSYHNLMPQENMLASILSHWSDIIYQ